MLYTAWMVIVNGHGIKRQLSEASIFELPREKGGIAFHGKRGKWHSTLPFSAWGITPSIWIRQHNTTAKQQQQQQPNHKSWDSQAHNWTKIQPLLTTFLATISNAQTKATKSDWLVGDFSLPFIHAVCYSILRHPERNPAMETEMPVKQSGIAKRNESQ